MRKEEASVGAGRAVRVSGNKENTGYDTPDRRVPPPQSMTSSCFATSREAGRTSRRVRV